MRFIDTSSQHPQSSLAGWFSAVAVEGIAELYLQTGYFAAGSLDFLLHTVSAKCLKGCKLGVLVGSNDPKTLVADIKKLIQVTGTPRKGADLAVVCFASGLFHPKTYVARRKDSTYTAYVGSANLTPSGLARNIEAGIILDTKEGDSEKTILEIVSSIQNWLTKGPTDGVHKLIDHSSADDLAASGILAIAAPPKPAATISSTSSTKGLPTLKPLTTWPTLPVVATKGAATNTTNTVPSIPAGGDILVAEITKGRKGKNRQIDLKKNIAETYFGGVGSVQTCSLISKNGQIISSEARTIGTKSSANFYVELSGLVGAVTGSYRDRPLLLMEKEGNKKARYRYFWLYPNDPEFNMVYDALIQPEVPNRKGDQSIKMVIPYFSLHKTWPANPFALAGALNPGE